MMRFTVVLCFQAVFAIIAALIGKGADVAIVLAIFGLGYISGNLNSIWWRQ